MVIKNRITVVNFINQILKFSGNIVFKISKQNEIK